MRHFKDFVAVVAALRIEPKASRMLGGSSTAKLQPLVTIVTTTIIKIVLGQFRTRVWSLSFSTPSYLLPPSLPPFLVLSSGSGPFSHRHLILRCSLTVVFNSLCPTVIEFSILLPPPPI